MGKWRLMNKERTRETYLKSDKTRVLLVATNTLMFRGNMGIVIPDKGKYLTRILKHWFDETCELVPNAFVPATMYTDKNAALTFGEAAIEQIKLDMLPVTIMVSGYLTGDMWETYSNDASQFCGKQLPDGLVESDGLPTPWFIPITEEGEYVSFDKLVSYFEAKGILCAYDRAFLLREHAMKLYNFAFEKLVKKGIVLANATFKFGIDPLSGNIMLGDEVLTPDSAEMWSIRDYDPGTHMVPIIEQPISEWIEEHPGERVIAKAAIEETALVYARLHDVITSDSSW